MARHSGVHGASLSLALLALGVASAAQACGSMGLDDPRNVARLTLWIFGPMLALIPVELWMLHRLGGLPWPARAIKAYLACLLAKFAGLQLVIGGVAVQLVQHVVTAELLYSIGHGAIAALVLGLGFKLTGRQLWTCVVAISTVIPWSYSLALYLLNHGIG